MLAATAPATAAADTQQLNVTVEYDLVPEDPEYVYVEATLENPDEISDEIEVRKTPVSGDEIEDVETNGFVNEEDGDDWIVREGVDNATFSYKVKIQSIQVGTESNTGTWDNTPQIYGDNGSWAIIKKDFTNSSSDSSVYLNTPQSVDESIEYVANNGYVLEYTQNTADEIGNYEEHTHIYLNENGVSVASAETEDASVTVVTDPEATSEDPAVIAQALADFNSEIEAGNTDQNFTAFGVPYLLDGDGNRKTGYALRENSNEYFVTASQSPFDSGSTWFHEHVHATDDMIWGSNVSWFSEGYANYGAIHYGRQAGYQDFDQYRGDLESWSGNRTVLSELLWTEANDNAAYNQGSRALAKLDYEIRTATDGTATVGDVLNRIREYDEFDLDDLVEATNKTVSENGGDGERVASEFETWITTTEPIFEDGLWTAEEHRRTFGGPNVTKTITAKRVDDDQIRNSTLDAERDVGMSTGEGLDVDLTLTNTGTVDSVRSVSLEIEDSESEEVVASHEESTVRLAPGENVTLSLSHEFEESGEYKLTTPSGSATIIVRDDGQLVSPADSAAEPSDPVLIDENESLGVAYYPVHKDWQITVASLDGDVILEDDSYDPVHWVNPDDIEPSRTYRVTIEDGDKKYVRYVSTLDPIDGTVPVDLNGDGLYRDISGDGAVNFPDLNTFFQHSDQPVVTDHVPAYDFEPSDGINLQDVMALLEEV